MGRTISINLIDMSLQLPQISIDEISIFFVFQFFQFWRACPKGMATYTLIIYQNYIISNLGEYILKFSSKSVDNYCKSWQSPIDFPKKAWRNCLLKNLQDYQKNKDIMSIRFLRWTLKKIEPKKQTFLSQNKTQKNNTNFCKDILSVLTASP